MILQEFKAYAYISSGTHYNKLYTLATYFVHSGVTVTIITEDNIKFTKMNKTRAFSFNTITLK